jgi:adenylate cyclase
LEKNERVNRKLAAILAADVVGYSRLMGADEVGTLRALKAARKDCLDPSIASYGGRIVKTTGDGLLVEFQSVVDAVACAVTMQRKMLTHDASAASDQRIVFRVGINIGDIIIDAKDIFGDGVNIAARLESICEPGGLCISDIAYDQVRDKLPLSFVDRGEQQVKNIVRPVRVFGLSPQAIAEAPELERGRAAPAKPRIPMLVGAALAAALLVIGGAWWAMRTSAPRQESAQPASIERRPSIAVLPLASLGTDSKDDYFGDGLTEDIFPRSAAFPSSSCARAMPYSLTKARRRSPSRSGATSTCDISWRAASAAAPNASVFRSVSPPPRARRNSGRRPTTSRRRTSFRCRTTSHAGSLERSPAG